MSRRYARVSATTDFWLRVGLAALWIWVLLRTGMQSFGYAIHALIADTTVVLLGRDQALYIRDPDGLPTPLTATELRAIEWIAPHLQEAHRLFVLGFLMSVLMWLTQVLYLGYVRSQSDLVFSARVDRSLDRLEGLLRTGIRSCIRGGNRLLTFRLKFSGSSVGHEDAASRPTDVAVPSTQGPEPSPCPSAPTAQPLPPPTVTEGVRQPLPSAELTAGTSAPSGPETLPLTPKASEGEPPPSPQPRRTSSFFTEF